MSGASMTIKERAVALNPNEVWQDRVGLVVHSTFRDRILPTFKSVERIPMGRYESSPLDIISTWIKSYPRRPQNERIARYSPTSAEMFVRLQEVRQGSLLTRWEHLAMLIHLQAHGQPNGLLVTKEMLATFCFMQGVGQEIFLVRVFWRPGGWFLRAWSFKERIDRGWNTMNWALLPATI